MPLVQLRVARRQSFVQFSIEDLEIGLSQRICHEVLTPVIGAVPHTLSAQIVSEKCIINDDIINDVSKKHSIRAVDAL